MRISLQAIRYAFLAACAVALVSTSAPLRAEDQNAVSEADAAAIRQIVQTQLDAFRRDDGAAAFGLASPNIQQMFGTPEIFMGMVKSGYMPVYRPKHVEFAQIDTVEGRLVQHLILIGPDGDSVEALYFMEREPDGKWRIDGCVLRPAYQA